METTDALLECLRKIDLVLRQPSFFGFTGFRFLWHRRLACVFHRRDAGATNTRAEPTRQLRVDNALELCHSELGG